MRESRKRDPGRAATVLVSVTVLPGREDEYRAWQRKVDRVVGGFSGFEATELSPPKPGEENVWTVIYRFSTFGQLDAWLDSPERRELLDEGRELFEKRTQEVLTGDAPVRDVVTAVVSHDVKPGREQDFVHWENRFHHVMAKAPGFMGFEFFKPIPGVQEDWVTVFRFDNRQNLDAWLNSEPRAKLLEEGREYLAGYEVRKIRSAFSGWFSFVSSAEEGLPPSWKQAMIVLLGIYPILVVLNVAVRRPMVNAGLPGYLIVFVTNVLSLVILTWLVMPLINRVFAFWLAPERSLTTRANVLGAVLVVAFYLLFIAIFWLLPSLD